MPVNLSLRASDADRERVATTLGRHTGEGRLTLAELEERMEWAYAARTLGDLEHLLADLPATLDEAPPTAHLEADGLSGVQSHPDKRHSRVRLRGRWMTYAAVNLVCVLIWLATSLASATPSYFWPVWVIGPWGLALLAKNVAAPRLPVRGCGP